MTSGRNEKLCDIAGSVVTLFTLVGLRLWLG